MSIGKEVSIAWDNYYKVVAGQLTYSGKPHEWTFDKVKLDNPKAVDGMEKGAEAVLSAQAPKKLRLS